MAQVPLAKDKELFWSVNRDGTRHILRAALDEGVWQNVWVEAEPGADPETVAAAIDRA